MKNGVGRCPGTYNSWPMAGRGQARRLSGPLIGTLDFGVSSWLGALWGSLLRFQDTQSRDSLLAGACSVGHQLSVGSAESQGRDRAVDSWQRGRATATAPPCSRCRRSPRHNGLAPPPPRIGAPRVDVVAPDPGVGLCARTRCGTTARTRFRRHTALELLKLARQYPLDRAREERAHPRLPINGTSFYDW